MSKLKSTVKSFIFFPFTCLFLYVFLAYLSLDLIVRDSYSNGYIKSLKMNVYSQKVLLMWTIVDKPKEQVDLSVKAAIEQSGNKDIKLKITNDEIMFGRVKIKYVDGKPAGFE